MEQGDREKSQISGKVIVLVPSKNSVSKLLSSIATAMGVKESNNISPKMALNQQDNQTLSSSSEVWETRERNVSLGFEIGLTH
jgi:hypothetical protein